jgi:hypothetical protein
MSPAEHTNVLEAANLFLELKVTCIPAVTARPLTDSLLSVASKQLKTRKTAGGKKTHKRQLITSLPHAVPHKNGVAWRDSSKIIREAIFHGQTQCTGVWQPGILLPFKRFFFRYVCQSAGAVLQPLQRRRDPACVLQRAVANTEIRTTFAETEKNFCFMQSKATHTAAVLSD